MKLLEVCCADIESVLAAKAGGADRIELCSGLECGGLTPSIGLVRKALELIPGKVNVLIRPRSGDFLYTPEELELIEEDIRAVSEAGAAGIVFGALTSDGELDMEVMRRMIAVSRPASFTLHRAFDVVKHPLESLERALDLGVDRILTSGGANSAVNGIATLRQLVKNADGRLKILAGAGVSAKNVEEIIRSTGVDEVHASCKHNIPSEMTFRNSAVSMGTPGTDEYLRPGTSSVLVKQLATIVHSL